jgi:hypothetical protein
VFKFKPMTQIFAQLCPGFVLQVEDRLVMADLSVGGSAKPDALANKNVVYQAQDAVVCMGYTGPAFIGSLPTDSWIVEKLTGINASMNFGTRIGLLPQWLDIGPALNLLERELRASEVATLEPNFELVVVGWQWNRSRRGRRRKRPAVPMAWQIHKPYGKTFEAVERLPRDWYWIKGAGAHFIVAPEGDKNLSLTEVEALAGRLRQVRPDPLGREYEQTVVDAIRTVSARNQYVGQNCMSILLLPPHLNPLVRVRFFPQEQHTARLVGRDFVSPEYPAAYSPWIVGQRIVKQPAVIIGGGWEIGMGPFKVLLEGVATKGVSAMSSQRRPSRPVR